MKFDENVVVETVLDGMDALEHMCRRIEALVHEDGWDQKPQFYSLSFLGDVTQYSGEGLLRAAKFHDHGEGEACLGGLALQITSLPDFAYDDAATGLLKFLKMLSDMESEHERKQLFQIMNAIVPRNFYGFGVMCEGWTLPETVSDEDIETIAGLGLMKDHPDRLEVRSLLVSTADGRIASLSRVRGGFPRYDEVDHTHDSVKGRLPTGIQLTTTLFDGFNRWRSNALSQIVATNVSSHN